MNEIRNVYLEKISFKKFSETHPYILNPELNTFKKDLLKQFDFQFNEETLTNGLQNRYIDMASTLIEEFSREELQNFDFIVIAHNTPDIDPSQSIICYLTEKYKLKSTSIALTDYGSNIGIGTISIVKKILQNNIFNKSLIILLEQNTIPLINHKENNYIDTGISIVLSTKKQEIEISEHIFGYMKGKPTLNEVLQKYNISEEEETVVITNLDLNNTSPLPNNRVLVDFSTISFQTLIKFFEKYRKRDFKVCSFIKLIEYDFKHQKLDILELKKL